SFAVRQAPNTAAAASAGGSACAPALCAPAAGFLRRIPPAAFPPGPPRPGQPPALGQGDGLCLLPTPRSAGDFPYPFNDRPQLPGNPAIWLVRENNDASVGGALLKYRSPLGSRWTLDALGELSLDSRGLAGPVENPTPDARETGRCISST